MSKCFELSGKTFAVSRQGLIRLCSLRDEYYEFVEEPVAFLPQLEENLDGRADLFTFIQPIMAPQPRFPYHLEFDSAAVLLLSTYEHWWKKQIKDKTRNMVRKARKAGVEVTEVEFNDALVRGIHVIYNETPVRQGRPFRHFAKDVETLRREHATFRDRSQFFGAYHSGQLIGFIKLVHGCNISNLMNIIAMIAHRDKAVTNALLAKAVEVCTNMGVRYLQYGTGTSGSIGDFKKHNAFEEVSVPRYYVPLTWKGALALKLGLHRRLEDRIPKKWRKQLLALHTKWATAHLEKSNSVGRVAPAAQRA